MRIIFQMFREADANSTLPVVTPEKRGFSGFLYGGPMSPTLLPLRGPFYETPRLVLFLGVCLLC